MPTFIICSSTDSSELEKKIVEGFPDHYFILRKNSQWLVDAEKTTVELSDSLEIGTAESDIKSLPVVVFLTSTYWGEHRTDLWEWLKLE